MRRVLPVVMSLLGGIVIHASADGQKRPDATCFQEIAPYSPKLDLGCDLAIIYGCGPDWPARAQVWRDHGYEIGMMTGIAWGEYAAHFGIGETLKRDEVQTEADGKLIMHDPGSGYYVPTPAYVEFMKKRMEPIIDFGVNGIFLEEPEFWSRAGWSPAFKAAWQEFYGEAWQAPNSSPDAQYRASKLKYELYFNTLKEVIAHIDDYAKSKGKRVETVVPTHSLINYAQWAIVSPETHLIDIPGLDGYVAQVWTGTARTPNRYRNVVKERTFETAYLEYGQMHAMVAPTGRKVWFLADPVEDNPNFSWNDYKRNYECTLVASLLWHQVARYEAMPWPSRIFQGKYPPTDMDAKSDARAGIPKDYMAQILTIINALNDMDQRDVVTDSGTKGIGLIVSDTLMFQRAAPDPGDPYFGCVQGLAMPLIKAGVPLEVMQLENALHAKTLRDFRVLLLTYEGQKPLKPEYHAALEKWVRKGGALILVDDGKDPYHHVREWWNEQGKNDARAFDDLEQRLGITDEAHAQPQAVGKGFVRVLHESPNGLTFRTDGADMITGAVDEMLRRLGDSLQTKNYFKVQRGPYVVVSVLDESVSDEPLRLQGEYVDLFDPTLSYVTERVLKPGERTLLYDLAWAREHGAEKQVIAAGARIREQKTIKRGLRFTALGPEGSEARACLVFPGPATEIKTSPEVPVRQVWSPKSKTLRLDFPNQARKIEFEVRY